MPTHKATRACAMWLTECLRLGWSRKELDFLEEIWWKYHTNQGDLKKKEKDSECTL